MTTILIAEDNAMVGLLMQMDLEGAGYTVRGPFARNDLALAAAADASVDLALLDIDLAGGDSGIDLARKLKAAHGTPCLFVTGQSYEAAGTGSLALGALTKPFTSQALLDVVRAALKRTSGERAEADAAVAWF